MVQHPIQLIDRRWSEGVTNLRSVERNPNCALVDAAVIGHINKVETVDGQPPRRIEQVRNCCRFHGIAPGSPIGAYGPTLACIVSTPTIMVRGGT